MRYIINFQRAGIKEKPMNNDLYFNFRHSKKENDRSQL